MFNNFTDKNILEAFSPDAKRSVSRRPKFNLGANTRQTHLHSDFQKIYFL